MMLKRIYRLLLPDERKKGGKVAATVFLTALLDFVGLASLLPVLYYLLEGGENHRAALWFSVMAMSVVVLKSVLVMCFTRYQNRYLLSLYRRFSYSLFSSYYRKGLLFIRKQGSNRLGYEVNYMCFAFCQGMLGSLLRMAGDGLLILLVTIALLVYDWLTVTVLYVSFCPFLIVYVWGVRKRVRRYGELELEAKREQNKVVMDTFRGYMDLEVSGAFPAQQAFFLKGMDKVIDSRVKMNTIMRLPMVLSELSVIVGLALLVLCGTGDVKVMVGIFAVAAFRLLPALRSVMSGWTQIQNVASRMDVMEEGLREEDTSAKNTKEIRFEKEIRICNLSFVYSEGGHLLEDFNASVKKGEYVGFRGYSGAGKSTLFNLLLGLLEPSSGEIRIDDGILSKETQASWLKRVGYVPQEVFVFHGTVAENVALGAHEVDCERMMQVLRQVCLDKWLHDLPDGLDTVLGEAGNTLSGGQKQRLGIARALYKNADVLFLDEATSALDNETEKEVNETLYRLKEEYDGLTILSIAHRESSLKYCDRIITIGKE